MDELDEFMGNLGIEHLTHQERAYIDNQVYGSCVPAQEEGKYSRFLQYQLRQVKQRYEDFHLTCIHIDDDSYAVYLQGITNSQEFELGWNAVDVLDPDSHNTVICEGFLLDRDQMHKMNKMRGIQWANYKKVREEVEAAKNSSETISR